MWWKIFGLVSCIKLLLMEAYKSTDFEVHRNWLAMTHSLPLNQWYVNDTSIWTLDYPPFFAWFEYFWSLAARLVDPEMLLVSNLNYDSRATVFFQRSTVIISDIVLALGAKKLSHYLCAHPLRKSSNQNHKWFSPSTVFLCLSLCNAGLLMVDHVHFQYNGILTGLLFLSIGEILEGNHELGAFYFSVLLNMKHIYLYVAPVYGVYLLRNHCWIEGKNGAFDVKKSLSKVGRLGTIFLLTTLVSFGPFIVHGQLFVVLRRLFPFKRGLCHSYWAPNFWVLYNIADKVLVILGRRLGWPLKEIRGSMTAGLVQEYPHTVLPSVTPGITLLLTVASMMPCLWKLWSHPGNPLHFVRSLIICAGCSFLFGWHVHEKAILIVILPLCFMAVLWRAEAECFLVVSLSGLYSLFPLLYPPEMLFVKAVLYLVFISYSFNSLQNLFRSRHPNSSFQFPLLNSFETIYAFGFSFLFVFEIVQLHKLSRLVSAYPFLYLMATSFYCSLGIIYGISRYYWNFLKTAPWKRKQKVF
ncbi:Asparagine-linked glycosylation 8, alpha-1,3-glucosyltransferase homolog (S. cerevisiae) [Nesidiocoris tenuis]|uniref:Alpha-1,3-glucosyltransferase n=1 Tax=Nesidiocoris tenuis TaxID=355587 RepID=A0ABN7AZ84_9HEMI|nr:Asparagine-linked glycosylation 8, alpha-1,3-glucosyltransferase homolog (S. cerevisiae) [Nesidiocoris tenuis]